ncbi:EamA family transporter RarD [bacterium]|nr:EamA family transporter RarD [bacterium]
MADLKADKNKTALIGITSAISAYLIWGLSPIYWKELHNLPALEIITHRIVWSFLLLFILILVFKQGREFFLVIRNPKMMMIMLVTSIVISVNWWVYIWSVNNGLIIQASLGYYINPLVNVLLGMIFLKERLRRFQLFAVILAVIGVSYLVIFYKTFPWVSLTLAFSFGFYALIRKIVVISSLVGLTIETLILSIPAVSYLLYLNSQGHGSFKEVSLQLDLMLIGAALVTALPLLLFNLAGKRLMLATLGFIQYLAPTCMFLIGIFLWGEVIVTAQIICFIFIWAALILYSADSVLSYRLQTKKSKSLELGK